MTPRLARPVATALAALAFASSAHAEELLIPVPGAGWHLRMDVPAGMHPADAAAGALYAGVSGRFQVSAFTEAHEWCPGPETNENIYACYTALLRKSPVADWNSERGNTAPNGVHIMYMSYATIDGKKGSAFNINVLFAHGGKWVDVHFSMASPKPDDADVLLAAAASVKAVDDGAPAGKAALAP